MRIDGVLHQVYVIPKAVHAPIVARLKILSRMDIAEKRRPQDGRIKTARDVGGEKREIELRASSVPTAFGEKVVLRIFETTLQELQDVGFAPEELEMFEGWINQPHGLVLVTGPTGSGKTTTLYAALKAIANDDLNITTIEDPVEMVNESFNQINIQPKIDLTFGTALRHVLRQDPDVIMVGEIRDAETAQYAVQAALTGHLVLSTLHTNDAASAVSRLLDLGVPSFLLANTLRGAMAQRLLRLVCTRCAKPVTLANDQIAALGLGRPEDLAGKLQVLQGEGCPRCRGTGYYGRTGIFELLPVTQKIQRLIAQGAPSTEIATASRLDGMRTLRENGVRKLAAGLTTFEEVWSATRDVEVALA
jgi:general secretion pathway protein E